MIFGFGKKKNKTEVSDAEVGEAEVVEAEVVEAEVVEAEVVEAEVVEAEVVEAEVVEAKTSDTETKKGYFARLKQGLSKTRSNFGDLFFGKRAIDDDLLDDLETALLVADVGIESTQRILDDVHQSLSRSQLKDGDALLAQLKLSMQKLLAETEQPLKFESNDGPFVLLMVGINGAGKTTTIGKIAQQLKYLDKSVMLAAGDTFRAAAVEQLKAWGERVDVPVVAQSTGSDSASVIFDAYQSAKAKNIDVLIADTAGRLHTQQHLMNEIEKIVRVLKKANADAPHEIMLVLDSGNGQNALNQAKEFNKILGLTGITITKLDGSAKGGILFSIANQLNIPVRFIGVGEAVDDLREFSANDFIDALLEVDR